MGAIRSSARALDELIYSNILTDEWDELEKETCQNFVRGKCKLGDKCPRSHAKSGRNNKGKDKNHPVKYHADISCEDDAIWATSASSATRENQTQQVDAAKTISRTPCEDATPTSTTKNASSDYGLKCWHAYRSSVNQRKDADKNLDEKIAKAKEVCRCCGRKGHTAKECNKLKAHLNA